MKITINKASLSDASVMFRWGEENWQLWGDKKGRWFSLKHLESWLKDQEDDVLLIAKDNDQPVGMCVINVNRDWAVCWGLFVIKSYRGQGVGRQLLEKAEKLLKKKKVNNYFLLVDMKNPDAVRFYQREGFYKGFEFYIMSKDLMKK